MTEICRYSSLPIVFGAASDALLCFDRWCHPVEYPKTIQHHGRIESDEVLCRLRFQGALDESSSIESPRPQAAGKAVTLGANNSPNISILFFLSLGIMDRLKSPYW